MKAFLTAAALCTMATAPCYATPAQARSACKQFITQSGYVVSDWGQYWDWTVIDNNDGSFSVGAKFVGMPPGGSVKNLYVTCITHGKGGKWTLEKLSRLQ